jgi:16S rRNA processing protein RimM
VSPANLVVIGRVGGAHGVSGALNVISSTQPPGNIERYRPWLLGDGVRFHEVEVLWVKAQGAGCTAALAGVTDRDAAQALVGQLIAVPRDALPALEAGREYYWQDLIGMTVVDGSGQVLGTVRRLLPTGAHDVLVIADAERELLIPFVEAFVPDVDLPARRIRVEWQAPA